ncbi:hypothetical protein BgiBS90_008262 [Biomphalaria glabrata]|nr:hypothetical protein BgiBS90_008262 [Biomphalaria glabrata]
MNINVSLCCQVCQPLRVEFTVALLFSLSYQVYTHRPCRSVWSRRLKTSCLHKATGMSFIRWNNPSTVSLDNVLTRQPTQRTYRQPTQRTYREPTQRTDAASHLPEPLLQRCSCLYTRRINSSSMPARYILCFT